jgi:hypothetical protein
VSGRVDLLCFKTENEHIVALHLLRYLDVGAVERADDDAAVHDELHVGGAARFHPGGRDVLRGASRDTDAACVRSHLADVTGGYHLLCQCDVVVGYEEHLQVVVGVGVCVHDL